MLALAHSGYDLVKANSIKVVVNAVLTLTAFPVFLWQGQVRWLPAIMLAVGYALGGTIGARLAVRGGERLIRPVLVVSRARTRGPDAGNLLIRGQGPR